GLSGCAGDDRGRDRREDGPRAGGGQGDPRRYAREASRPAVGRTGLVSALRVAVLASGTGTNLQAIIDQLHGKEIEVRARASDKPVGQALERAAGAGIETESFAAADYPDRRGRDAAIGDWLDERDVDLIVLAGYMQLLSPKFVGRYPNRIVNVHPALLPSFP